MFRIRAAIVHYHLQAGGVTRVIADSVAALRDSGIRTVILSGAPSDIEIPSGTDARVVEGLNYKTAASCPPAELVRRLRAAAQTALGAPPDIWHIHNHSLGKNIALTDAVCRLAEAGHSLLLQIHDFAEDGRPDNYRALLHGIGRGCPARLTEHLYPQAPHVHYALLNRRDRGIMRSAGVPSGRCHLLPNPVFCMESTDKADDETIKHSAGRLFLYPTRAIRRKNIGEFLLWSALASPGDRFAATLAPTDPAERRVYAAWVRLARRLRLPVEFEIGMRETPSYQSLMRSAHAIVTTSVGEGFGLAFLEPWLMDRPLLGRDIPDITADFKEKGVRFRGLYERLWIPMEWVGCDRFRRCIRRHMNRLWSAYGQRLRAGDMDRGFAAMIRDDRVDFGRLDEPLQADVLRRVASGSALRQDLDPSRLDDRIQSPALIAGNHRLVSSAYGRRHYGARLARLYASVLNDSAASPDSLDGDVILKGFLNPEKCFPLRT